MSLVTNISDLAVRVATEIKSLRVLINGNASDLNALTTTAKSNLVAAINELDAAVTAASQSGGASIDDNAIAASTTWSSTKINTTIDNDVAAAVSGLVNGAPLALDTLKELADALEAADESEEIAIILTALDNRVRFDAAQTLTGAQQVQARANIGAGTSDLTIGTTGTTAKAGDYVPSWGEITSKPTTFDPTTHGHAWGEITGKPATFAPSTHSHPSSEITDATSLGRSLITAVDAAAARTAIGAGTSNLVIGTTAGTAKDGAYQPTWAQVTGKPTTFAPTAHTHTASQISDATVAGRAVITATDATAIRNYIGAQPAADIGDTTTDFAAQFVAGLA